MSMPHNNSMIR